MQRELLAYDVINTSAQQTVHAMRYLILLLFPFLIGCGSDPVVERDDSNGPFSKVQAAFVVEETPHADGTRTASEASAPDADEATPAPRGSSSGMLPSQSMTAYPHTPGLSHVSVFSVHRTDTEVQANDRP